MDKLIELGINIPYPWPSPQEHYHLYTQKREQFTKDLQRRKMSLEMALILQWRIA